MKIAICISGYPRTFKKSFESFKRVFLDRFDCDLFISTWANSFDSVNIELDEFCKLYNPMLFECEIYSNIMFDRYSNKSLILNSGLIVTETCLPMYYKIFKANLLKKIHEFKLKQKYDLVIRTRSDLNYLNDIGNDEIQYAITNDDVVFCRKDTEHDKNYSNIDWCWDQFAFGSSKAMDFYADTFINIEECLKSSYYKKINNKSGIQPYFAAEFMFRENLYLNNIKTKQSNIRYEFIR